MCPEKKNYYIAWVLSSHDQYEAAHGRFDDSYNYYSFGVHITYTLGKVGRHNVVMASPASKADTPTVDIIINDLLLQFPSIRAGFVVSTDAYVPRGRWPGVGDVILSGEFPDMGHGVVYVDVEKTNKEKRLFMTGQSGNVPSVLAAAVEGLKTQEQHTEGQTLYGVIASSAQQMKDSNAGAWRGCLCFETAASTMKGRPLSLLAGITKYCGEDENISVRERTCKAVILSLTRLIQHIDHDKLVLEPAIVEYFEHEALDLGKSACRLLRLEGGTGQLQCHLFQAYLPSEKKTSDDEINDETMLIPYEALSYCWGSNGLTQSIRVNGKVLSITSNLFQALEYLRLADRDRILWIDAICIDQLNALERGHQVDMMGKLYRQADEVLIWLGDIGDDTGELISVLQTFEAIVPSEARRKWAFEDTRYQDLWVQAQRSPLEDESSLQSKLKRLMNNPWFSRVWIIQEVANANRASLGCTDGWIDARTFAVVPKLLRSETSSQCQAIIDIMPGVSRKSSWFSQRPNLSTLLWKFRESRASDPRDKLYALLGISSDKPIPADYSKTEEAIVEEMMVYIFQEESITPHLRSFSKIDAIPYLLSKRTGQLILRGANHNDLNQFTKLCTTPFLLSTESVDYLQYVGSPFLVEFVHQNALVLENTKETRYEGKEFTTNFIRAKLLPSFLAEIREIQVSSNILEASRQNDMNFVDTALNRDGNDMAITHDLILEAISHGPSVLEQFIGENKNRTRSDAFIGGQKNLEDLWMLWISFDHAGIFLKSDTLRRLIYEHYNPRSSPSLLSHDTMDIAEIIADTNLQDMDASLQAFLRHPWHQKKVVDEVSLKNIRGGQDGIMTFLEQGGRLLSRQDQDLMSKYSVELFLSSRSDHVEIMQLDMRPYLLDSSWDDEYETQAWKILVPHRLISQCSVYGHTNPFKGENVIYSRGYL